MVAAPTNDKPHDTTTCDIVGRTTLGGSSKAIVSITAQGNYGQLLGGLGANDLHTMG